MPVVVDFPHNGSVPRPKSLERSEGQPHPNPKPVGVPFPIIVERAGIGGHAKEKGRERYSIDVSYRTQNIETHQYIDVLFQPYILSDFALTAQVFNTEKWHLTELQAL